MAEMKSASSAPPVLPHTCIRAEVVVDDTSVAEHSSAEAGGTSQRVGDQEVKADFRPRALDIPTAATLNAEIVTHEVIKNANGDKQNDATMRTADPQHEVAGCVVGIINTDSSTSCSAVAMTRKQNESRSIGTQVSSRETPRANIERLYSPMIAEFRHAMHERDRRCEAAEHHSRHLARLLREQEKATSRALRKCESLKAEMSRLQRHRSLDEKLIRALRRDLARCYARSVPGMVPHDVPSPLQLGPALPGPHEAVAHRRDQQHCAVECATDPNGADDLVEHFLEQGDRDGSVPSQGGGGDDANRSHCENECRSDEAASDEHARPLLDATVQRVLRTLLARTKAHDFISNSCEVFQMLAALGSMYRADGVLLCKVDYDSKVAIPLRALVHENCAAGRSGWETVEARSAPVLLTTDKEQSEDCAYLGAVASQSGMIAHCAKTGRIVKVDSTAGSEQCDYEVDFAHLGCRGAQSALAVPVSEGAQSTPSYVLLLTRRVCKPFTKIETDSVCARAREAIVILGVCGELLRGSRQRAYYTAALSLQRSALFDVRLHEVVRNVCFPTALRLRLRSVRLLLRSEERKEFIEIDDTRTTRCTVQGGQSVIGRRLTAGGLVQVVAAAREPLYMPSVRPVSRGCAEIDFPEDWPHDGCCSVYVCPIHQPHVVEQCDAVLLAYGAPVATGGSGRRHSPATPSTPSAPTYARGQHDDVVPSIADHGEIEGRGWDEGVSEEDKENGISSIKRRALLTLCDSVGIALRNAGFCDGLQGALQNSLHGQAVMEGLMRASTVLCGATSVEEWALHLRRIALELTCAVAARVVVVECDEPVAGAAAHGTKRLRAASRAGLFENESFENRVCQQCAVENRTIYEVYDEDSSEARDEISSVLEGAERSLLEGRCAEVLARPIRDPHGAAAAVLLLIGSNELEAGFSPETFYVSEHLALVAEKTLGMCTEIERASVLRSAADDLICVATDLRTAENDLSAVNDTAMKSIQQLLGANSGALFLLDTERNCLVLCGADDAGELCAQRRLSAPSSFAAPHETASTQGTPPSVHADCVSDIGCCQLRPLPIGNGGGQRDGDNARGCSPRVTSQRTGGSPDLLPSGAPGGTPRPESVLASSAAPSSFPGQAYPTRVGITGLVATEMERMVIPDARCDPRFNAVVDEASAESRRVVARHTGPLQLMCSPLVWDGRCIGVLVARYYARDSEDVRPISSHRRMLFDRMCDILSASVFHARERWALESLHRTAVRWLDAPLPGTLIFSRDKFEWDTKCDIFEHRLPLPSPAEREAICATVLHELASVSTASAFDATVLSPEALICVCCALLDRLGVASALATSAGAVQLTVAKICAQYHTHNAYHNFAHAVDVLHTVAVLLNKSRSAELLDGLDVAATAFAALLHDVAHPGVNNAFLIRCDSKFARVYNDRKVLEHFHASFGYALLTEPSHSILAGLSATAATRFRDIFLSSVLHTDIEDHFTFLESFERRICSERNSPKLSPIRDDDRKLVCAIVLKCADLGNACRTFPVARKWAERIQEEFHRQAELELSLGHSVSNGHIRGKSSVAANQIKFIDSLAEPIFALLDRFDPLTKEFHASLLRNRAIWEKLRAQSA